MYEFEVNHSSYIKSDLPENIQHNFSRELNFGAISVFQWEEHCTECAMPKCYKTCDLYEARKDGKCRRFTEGISPVRGFDNNRVIRVAFKKWGALMATGYLDIFNVNKASSTEKRADKIASIASSIPDGQLSVLGRRGISSRVARRLKKRMIEKLHKNEKINVKPDYFLIEIFNPNKSILDLTFVIRATEGNSNARPFQERLKLNPGYHVVKLEYALIEEFIDLKYKHYLSFIPNIEEISEKEVVAFFGFIGLVKENELLTLTKDKPVKVVAWDLDNTVWKGVLVEDGEDSLELVPNIKTVMETLDKRGIVNSVVSKNNHDDAFKQLVRHGLDKLIVFPKISWNPKSEAIKAMISDFNVGADTVVFIDDSPFEREEVKIANPDVRVFDALDYMQLLTLPEFNPKQSSESSLRREFYKNQNKRKKDLESFSGDYLDFIKSCNIKLSISKAIPENADRIQELVQRTNQMNFSGNRYQREEIEKLLINSELDNYCIKCEDKFGDYGTVGFCIIDNKVPQLIDLMFSCRIQSKRVEHAFLSWILLKYHKEGLNKFSVRYCKTDKNTPAGKVFGDLGFKETERIQDIIIYEYDYKQEIQPDGLINIEFDEAE